MIILLALIYYHGVGKISVIVVVFISIVLYLLIFRSSLAINMPL